MLQYVFLSIVCLFALYIVFEVLSGIGRTAPSDNQHASSDESEIAGVHFRDIWLDVAPAPLKVIVIADGKIEGQLVMHGPHEGVLKRLLILTKVQRDREGKVISRRLKSYQLDALCGIQSEAIEGAYACSVAEAKRIAQAVLGKKKQAKPAAPVTEQAPPKPKAEAPPAPKQTVVAPEPKQAVPANAVSAPAVPAPAAAEESTMHKGFIRQHVGVVVSAGMQTHTKIDKGVAVEYQSYTLVIDTPNGLEHITGNDLKRAMVNAAVGAGDPIRVVHVKNETLTNGFTKKQYLIAKLPQ